MQGCWAANVAGQPRKGGKEKGGGSWESCLEGKTTQSGLGEGP